MSNRSGPDTSTSHDARRRWISPDELFARVEAAEQAARPQRPPRPIGSFPPLPYATFGFLDRLTMPEDMHDGDGDGSDDDGEAGT